MAIGEAIATTGVTAAPVSVHKITTLDGVTVTERDLQRILLSYLTASGVAITISPTAPMPVTGTFALASEGHVGEVGGNCAMVTPTITVSTTTYAIGDVVGGKITFTDAMRIVSGSGVLQDLFLFCRDGELLTGTLLVFNADPTASIADNAAWAWTAGDDTKCIAKIKVVAGDWDVYGSDSIAHLKNLGIIVKANGVDNLYGYFITSGTPTFAATNDFFMHAKFFRD
jgi:hypothetical protein